MKQSKATTSQSRYTKSGNVLPFNGPTTWSPSEDYRSSWNGGGGDMETRVSVLESNVRHIKEDIGGIRTDIRHIVYGLIGVPVTLLIAGSAGLWNVNSYLESKIDKTELKLESKIDSARTELKSDMQAMRLELKSDMQEMKKELKSEMIEMKSDIKEIKDAINKISAKN